MPAKHVGMTNFMPEAFMMIMVRFLLCQTGP
jgi:hypothetical protein